MFMREIDACKITTLWWRMRVESLTALNFNWTECQSLPGVSSANFKQNNIQ